MNLVSLRGEVFRFFNLKTWRLNEGEAQVGVAVKCCYG